MCSPSEVKTTRYIAGCKEMGGKVMSWIKKSVDKKFTVINIQDHRTRELFKGVQTQQQTRSSLPE